MLKLLTTSCILYGCFLCFAQNIDFKNSLFSDSRFSINHFTPIGLKLSDPYCLGSSKFDDLSKGVSSCIVYVNGIKKEKYSFNTNGLLQEELMFERGRLKFKNINLFNPQGEFIGEERYIGSRLEHREDVIRSKDKKVVYHYTKSDNKGWDTLQVQSYYYSEVGCDSIVNEMSYWNAKHLMKFAYRTTGELVSSDHYFNADKNPTIIYFYVYRDKKLIGIHDYSGEQIHFDYDENGALSEASYPSKEIKYKDGLPIEITTIGGYGSDSGMVKRSISYVFDERGNWIEKKELTSDGKKTTTKRVINYF